MLDLHLNWTTYMYQMAHFDSNDEYIEFDSKQQKHMQPASKEFGNHLQFQTKVILHWPGAKPHTNRCAGKCGRKCHGIAITQFMYRFWRFSTYTGYFHWNALKRLVSNQGHTTNSMRLSDSAITSLQFEWSPHESTDLKKKYLRQILKNVS